MEAFLPLFMYSSEQCGCPFGVQLNQSLDRQQHSPKPCRFTLPAAPTLPSPPWHRTSLYTAHDCHDLWCSLEWNLLQPIPTLYPCSNESTSLPVHLHLCPNPHLCPSEHKGSPTTCTPAHLHRKIPVRVCDRLRVMVPIRLGEDFPCPWFALKPGP